MTAPHRAYRALLHDGLSVSARNWPDKTAVDTGKEACSFRELDDSSTRLAAALAIAWSAPRRPRCHLHGQYGRLCDRAYLPYSRLAACFLVINPQTKHDKLCFIANDCSIRHLLTDIHLAEVASAVIGNVTSLTPCDRFGTNGDLQQLSGQRHHCRVAQRPADQCTGAICMRPAPYLRTWRP